MDNNKDTKKCPFCGEEIKYTAKKCKFCKEWFINSNQSQKINNKTTIYISICSIVVFILVLIFGIANSLYLFKDFEYASIKSTKNLNPAKCKLTHKEIIETLNQQFEDCIQYINNKDNPIYYREKLFLTYYKNIQYYVAVYNQNFTLKDSDFSFLGYNENSYWYNPVYSAYKDGILYKKEGYNYYISAPSPHGLYVAKEQNKLKVVFDETVLTHSIFLSENWYSNWNRYIYVKDKVIEHKILHKFKYDTEIRTSLQLFDDLNKINSDFPLVAEKNDLTSKVAQILLLNSETFETNKVLNPQAKSGIEEVMASVSTDSPTYKMIEKCYSILQAHSYIDNTEYRSCVSNIK